MKDKDIYNYYLDKLVNSNSINNIKFTINKTPSYPIFKNKINDLPWDKYPIIIAGGSFSNNTPVKITNDDKILIDTLLKTLDPDKVFFVVGHKVQGQEKYLLQQNKTFDIYSIVPSMISKTHINKLNKYDIKGFRISTEAQDMGIYKSFNR